MLVFLFSLACSTETKIQMNTDVVDENIDEMYEQDIQFVEDISFLSELFEEFHAVNQTAEPMMYDERDYGENYSATGIVHSTYEIFADIYFDDNNGCPIIREMSNQIAIRGGGCTTEENIEYDGRILFKPYGEIVTMDFQNFSIKEESPLCLDHFDSITYQGGMVFYEESTEAYVLVRKDIVQYDKGCKKTEQSYWFQSNLHIELDDIDAYSFWNGMYNGTGTVLQVGDKTQFIDITTIDQRIDTDICRFEPLSGSNVITNGIDTFEFMYNGEKECDIRAAQMLSINGSDTKEVSGASCSQIDRTSSWFVLLLSLLPVWRRSSHR